MCVFRRFVWASAHICVCVCVCVTLQNEKCRRWMFLVHLAVAAYVVTFDGWKAHTFPGPKNFDWKRIFFQMGW